MSAATAQELKQLQTRLSETQAKLQQAFQEAREAQQREALVRRQKDEIEKQIEALKAQAVEVEPVVSEHALLRYFERVLEYDLDVIRDGLLSGNMKAIIKQMKSGRFPCGDAFLVVRNGVVTTIETNELRKPKKVKAPRYRESGE